MKKLVVLAIVLACFFPFFGSSNSNVNQGGEKSVSLTPVADSNNVEYLTKTSFQQKIWDYTKSPNEWKFLGSKPAIIDFYADWCGPCRIAGPILEEVGNEFGGKVQVYKINTDQEKELAQVFGITGIPAFLYIPMSGKPVMMSGIARSKDETKQMFIDNIGKILQVNK